MQDIFEQAHYSASSECAPRGIRPRSLLRRCTTSLFVRSARCVSVQPRNHTSGRGGRCVLRLFRRVITWTDRAGCGIGASTVHAFTAGDAALGGAVGRVQRVARADGGCLDGHHARAGGQRAAVLCLAGAPERQTPPPPRVSRPHTPCHLQYTSRPHLEPVPPLSPPPT